MIRCDLKEVRQHIAIITDNLLPQKEEKVRFTTIRSEKSMTPNCYISNRTQV